MICNRCPFFGNICRELRPSALDAGIACYIDSIPIFERFNIGRQIEQTGQRKVALPSGGGIIVDETEALIAIDVNTGSHKNRSGDEKNTIYAVNLEAANEAARQIRLRNLGGLIIIDFIDMKERRQRQSDGINCPYGGWQPVRCIFAPRAPPVGQSGQVRGRCPRAKAQDRRTRWRSRSAACRVAWLCPAFVRS